MKKICLFYFISMFLFISCSDVSSINDIKNEIKLLPPKGNKIYFGAFPDFGGSEDNVSSKKITDFNNMIKKKIVWAYFSDNWFNTIKYPKQSIHEIYKNKTIPFVRIMPRSDEIQGHKEEVFSMQNIIDGKFDSDLKAWANEAKKDNIPLLVDFAVEPNGDWFSWSGKFNGGSITNEYGNSDYPDGAERYRDAYRHIIDLFKAQGVKNITWFYHFNYASYPNEQWNQAKYYYPGDEYIDWIGFSLYGAQTLDEEYDGLEFSIQLSEFYNSIESLNTTKPIALLEFGVTDNHNEGNKSVWLNDAFETILNNPYIKFSAISPWHENWENDDETYSTLRIDSSEESLNTFKNLIKNERFISKARFE